LPEGDTIHRAAERLRAALEGEELVRFEAPRARGPHPPPGTRIDAVEARGKHVLIHFAGGIALHTHMRMTGSWHLYRAGERWRRPPWLARAIVGVDGWEAVCFAAPVVRLRREGGEPDAVDRLGPDLCRDDADIDLAVTRMGAVVEPETTIAEALLDQRVAAGVGNVFKSETLFACGVHPSTPVGRLDEPERRRLLDTASRQLRSNLGGGPRATVPGGLAVYGRAGRPCRRCGTPVRSARFGRQPRSTYWCPSCQPGGDG
jgi:endonuclease-8